MRLQAEKWDMWGGIFVTCGCHGGLSVGGSAVEQNGHAQERTWAQIQAVQLRLCDLEQVLSAAGKELELHALHSQVPLGLRQC